MYKSRLITGEMWIYKIVISFIQGYKAHRTPGLRFPPTHFPFSVCSVVDQAVDITKHEDERDKELSSMITIVNTKPSAVKKVKA